jgi:hypothetical protein
MNKKIIFSNRLWFAEIYLSKVQDNVKAKEKQSFDYPACSSSKKAFNTTVIDLAKYDRYFLTKHFHSIQSSEALFPTVPGVSLSQSIPVTKSR